jgi:CheY-like chemotaxis protein
MTAMTQIIPPANVVLYADDDEDDLMLVTDAFARYTQNVEVVTALDGLEALSYLRNLSPFDPLPCLIILDINMPQLNGKQVLKDIKSMGRFRDIPVVLFSTSSHPADKKFAEEYNAGFITKPLDLKQMRAITEQFVEFCSSDVRKNIARISNSK